jgi:hypothetical protein
VETEVEDAECWCCLEVPRLGRSRPKPPEVPHCLCGLWTMVHLRCHICCKLGSGWGVSGSEFVPCFTGSHGCQSLTGFSCCLWLGGDSWPFEFLVYQAPFPA